MRHGAARYLRARARDLGRAATAGADPRFRGLKFESLSRSDLLTPRPAGAVNRFARPNGVAEGNRSLALLPRVLGAENHVVDRQDSLELPILVHDGKPPDVMIPHRLEGRLELLLGSARNHRLARETEGRDFGGGPIHRGDGLA